MKKAVEELRAFLEDAHKNGTDCATAEQKLIMARQVLGGTVNRDEKAVLQAIIAELEQVHMLCSIPANIKDEEPECGC